MDDTFYDLVTFVRALLQEAIDEHNKRRLPPLYAMIFSSVISLGCRCEWLFQRSQASRVEAYASGCGSRGWGL